MSVHDGSFHILSHSLFANPNTWPKHVACPSVNRRNMNGRQASDTGLLLFSNVIKFTWFLWCQ
jgi:hypothetical protein